MPPDPPESEVKLTPMLRQYHALRRQLPDDVLLLFRLGDFYELFFDDAKVAAPLLNVALTKRNGMPMCGVPYHAAGTYLPRLIQAGKRVALAEQTTEPQPGKIVEREISQIISAATIDDLSLLDSARPNYLAAVFQAKGRYGLAVVEHSTGEFRLAEYPDHDSLLDEIDRLRPSETLYSEEQAAAFDLLPGAQGGDAYPFLREQAEHLLKRHFKVQHLDGFGCAGLHPAICAAGAALHYLETQLRRSVAHLRRLEVHEGGDHLLIDAASQANLDLVPRRDPNGPAKGASLLEALDRTRTPMGARLLRHWILHPLRQLAPLLARQEAVAAMLRDTFALNRLRETLGEIRDIERTLGRLSQGSGNARDLKALEASLRQVPAVRELLQALAAGDGRDATDGRNATDGRTEADATEGGGGVPPENRLAGLLAGLGDFGELVELLGRALVDEPPATLKEGGIFAEGYSQAIDELRQATGEGRQWIANLQRDEQARTGIHSLKIKYNAVFGYFIEITKAHLDKVPPEYTRKQTMANAERFVTPELKEVENRILGADERLRSLEQAEFLNLRETVLESLEAIQAAAAALAESDALASFAETARLHGYCRPLLDESRKLLVRNGRHPVLDQSTGEEKFVPNHTDLDEERNRFMLITGPNMAGKSTYIRQVALIALLAQTGSYVPADHAEIGLVDRIFTRVGASDDLARGRSTFMVEMTETALIANHATADSLVVLDEIGRGTATYDGLSIAWSVAEHLHDVVGCRALFATHYHELTELAAARPALNNYHIAVREWNEQIIFLRQILPGTADKSYGIHVAKLAGLPDSIVRRATQILAGLEGTAPPGERGEPAVGEPTAAPPDPASSPAEPAPGAAPPAADPRRKTPPPPRSEGDDGEEAYQMLLFG